MIYEAKVKPLMPLYTIKNAQRNEVPSGSNEMAFRRNERVLIQVIKWYPGENIFLLKIHKSFGE